jgi:hypothetical protein|tara:strand:- start:246 stop:437 length:192 start_codon:yes stop_codon:yes gene_type:complete
MSFIDTLSARDHRRLREIIFGVHMKNYPKEHFNVREADKLIESLGPEVAEQLIKRGVDTHSVE